jgi:hypothetical protein
MRLLSTLDSLDGAGPAESVSQTQPKTGAGLASCDVTTRIERLSGFGCMRSGQSACQYLESNADQRAAQLSTTPANARIRCGNDCANGIDDPSHLKPLSGACRKASGQASAAVAQTPGSPRYSVLPKTVAAFREVCSETAGHHPRPSQCRLVQIEARIRDRAGTSKRSRRHRLPWRGRLPRPR